MENKRTRFPWSIKIRKAANNGIKGDGKKPPRLISKKREIF